MSSCHPNRCPAQTTLIYGTAQWIGPIPHHWLFNLQASFRVFSHDFKAVLIRKKMQHDATSTQRPPPSLQLLFITASMLPVARKIAGHFHLKGHRLRLLTWRHSGRAHGMFFPPPSPKALLPLQKSRPLWRFRPQAGSLLQAPSTETETVPASPITKLGVRRDLKKWHRSIEEWHRSANNKATTTWIFKRPLLFDARYIKIIYYIYIYIYEYNQSYHIDLFEFHLG